MNTVKRKLREGLPSIGSWITIAHPAVAEIMAAVGFEWLTLDLEHGAIGIESLQSMVQATSASPVIPVARVPCWDRWLVNRVLDTGVRGVIFAMVNSREDALEAVRSAKYPPDGTRGVGLARAQGYTEEGRREYLRMANEQMLVILQVEHRTAVENIDAIVTVDGIDALYIGPSDLAASLGLLGEEDHPRVQSAIDAIRSSAHRAKVPLGIPVNKPEDASRWIAEGYQFLQLSVDELYLSRSCRDAVRAVNGLLAKHLAERTSV